LLLRLRFADDYAFMVAIDLASVADGIMGSAVCSLDVASSTGELLYETMIDFVVLEGGNQERSISVPKADVSRELTTSGIEGASAEFACSPQL
jgi:hypothetical protein